MRDCFSFGRLLTGRPVNFLNKEMSMPPNLFRKQDFNMISNQNLKEVLILTFNKSLFYQKSKSGSHILSSVFAYHITDRPAGRACFSVGRAAISLQLSRLRPLNSAWQAPVTSLARHTCEPKSAQPASKRNPLQSSFTKGGGWNRTDSLTLSTTHGIARLGSTDTQRLRDIILQEMQTA